MDVSASQIEPVVFNPGDLLFEENERSFHFFIIQKGEVEVYKTADNGRKVRLAVVSEGTSIGEFAMIDRLPRSATAVALTEVEAVKVSDAAYQKLLEDLPDWAVAVMRALVERLRQTNEIVRRANIADPEVQKEIQSVEFDPEASTVKRKNPLLAENDDDDLPDLG